jgi:uncharacterized membrane protein
MFRDLLGRLIEEVEAYVKWDDSMSSVMHKGLVMGDDAQTLKTWLANNPDLQPPASLVKSLVVSTAGPHGPGIATSVAAVQAYISAHSDAVDTST